MNEGKASKELLFKGEQRIVEELQGDSGVKKGF